MDATITDMSEPKRVQINTEEFFDSIMAICKDYEEKHLEPKKVVKKNTFRVSPEIYWEGLREEFYKQDIQGMTPHDLFKWFKEKLS